MRFGSCRSFAELLLLAPPYTVHNATLGSSKFDPIQYDNILAEVQRLRARLYLRDGAVNPRRISHDGRLFHPHDEYSWQVVIRNSAGSVVGCARYASHGDDVPFSSLGVAGSALAIASPWSSQLRNAVEVKRTAAQQRGIDFAEVGGWAIADELRYSRAALDIFLNVSALARLFGGAIGITTATFRHQSSSILRRLGGRGLRSDDGIVLPSYYDPQYDCHMEILQFDTDYPNPRYVERIEACLVKLVSVPAISEESIIRIPAPIAGDHSSALVLEDCFN